MFVITLKHSKNEFVKGVNASADDDDIERSAMANVVKSKSLADIKLTGKFEYCFLLIVC